MEMQCTCKLILELTLYCFPPKITCSSIGPDIALILQKDYFIPFFFLRKTGSPFLPAASQRIRFTGARRPLPRPSVPGYHGNRKLTSLRASAPDPGVDHEAKGGEVALPRLRMRAPAPLLPGGKSRSAGVQPRPLA